MSIFTAADDDFHFAQMSEKWWETETCWFSFAVPERKLGGWVYIMARPNIGTVAGGAWIWDDTAELPWEVLHSANYTAMRLPRDQNLSNIQLPTGVSVKMLEPLSSYEVGYQHGERVKLAMRFDAVMPPLPLTNVKSAYAHLSHFDQIGHVTGTLTLDTETIPIDCYAMRDRSWGPRPEHRPLPASYVTAMQDAKNGFLAITNPGIAGDPVTHGFLLRDGIVSPLASGHRHVTRNPATCQTQTIRIEAEDQLGRQLHAEGEAQSRIIINRHSFINSMSLVRWSLNSAEAANKEAWGEDQDIWPLERWAAYVRRKRAERS